VPRIQETEGKDWDHTKMPQVKKIYDIDFGFGFFLNEHYHGVSWKEISPGCGTISCIIMEPNSQNYVSCRHLMGEDLESLNLKELQQLEQQLESSLKHIRSRKVLTILLK
jgi:hypothetical protein